MFKLVELWIVVKIARISFNCETSLTPDLREVEIVCKSFEMFKDYRESVLFFFKECQDKDWFKEAGVSYEKQLITLLNIVELTYREINSHVNSTENKKINTNTKKMQVFMRIFSLI